MITFDRLLCNGVENPQCIDDSPLFQWSYCSGYEREVVQRSFLLEILDGTGSSVFSCRCRSARMQLSCKEKLLPLTEYQWRVTAKLSNGQLLTSEMQRFATGLLGAKPESFGAHWIAGKKKYEARGVSFRKSMMLDKPVRCASGYFFAAAWQKISVNGTQLKPDCFLLPPNSSYTDRCIYEKYDLTPFLRAGENVLDLLTGGGYNAGYSCFGWHLYCGKAVIGFVDVCYEDGTAQRIVTDESWQLFSSPITYCDIYHGEHYDATHVPQLLEQARVIASPVKKAKFTANEMPHIKAVRTVTPISCKKCGTALLVDMGENFCGVAKITLSAPRGTKIALQFSEMVYADGQQRTTTNCTAQARDIYICSGDGVECYTPSFTYHGYRYIRISGVTSRVQLLDVAGLALSADIDGRSSFACSDPVVNKVHQNVVRSLRSNLLSIPTDCPSRGERTPCAMDSVCGEVAGIYNFRMQGFYRKWLGDIVTGADTADDHGNPDWDGDKIMLAHRLLTYCADEEIVRKYYKGIKACLEMFRRNSPDGLWREGFGDWCHLNEHTWETYHGSVMAVNTCLYYKVCCQMADIAKTLHRLEDAVAFRLLAEKVKKAFCQHLLKADGTVDEGTHSAQALALYADIVSQDMVPAVLDQLVRKLKTEPMDLGIFGMMAIADVLPRYGHSDLLYTLLQNPQYPGYLYQIANGATSLWEVWAFEGPMASHNHAMFAGIDDAFYAGFAGIRPLEPGFARFAVEPRLPGKMSFVNCAVDTVSGCIRLHYEKTPAGSELRLDVPANTKAEVWLPEIAGAYALHDGEVILPDSAYARRDGCIRMTLGSGRYHLRMVSREYLYPNQKED